MDDATVQEVIDLENLLDNDSISGMKTLPGSNIRLQQEIETIKNISDSREMKLNCKKTKVIVSNFSKKYQFKSLLTIPGQNLPIEETTETKLLGYWLTSN